MIIKYELIDELNEAVKKHYEEEDYDLVVVKALKLLSHNLKERFEFDLDGVALIDAIIERDCKYRFTSVYSELNEYTIKGILLYLKGLYFKSEIPHYEAREMISKDDANMILLNINYVLFLIDVKKKKFDIDEFMGLIGKPYNPFEMGDHADDMVDALPKERRLEVILKMIDILSYDNYEDFEMFYFKLLRVLPEKEQDEVLKAMDEVFLKYNTFEDLYKYLSIFPANYFKRLNKQVQEKIEGLIFDDFVKATIDININEPHEYGAFSATTSHFYLEQFDKKKWTDELIRKLNSNKYERDFARKFMFNGIAIINRIETEESFLNYLIERINKNDRFIIEFIENFIFINENHPWAKLLKK